MSVFDNIPATKDRSRNESGLWSLLKGNLPPGLEYDRIETGGTGKGIPDFNATWEGRDFWIEFKVCAGNKVGLRPEQVGWHLRRSEAGATTFILVRRKAEGPRIGKVDSLYLYHGAFADALDEQGLKFGPLLKLDAPYDWRKLWDTIYHRLPTWLP